MSWEIEYTNEFGEWWESLDEGEQVDVDAVVGLLAEKGASLPFPYSSGISGSKHSHMRELRIQHAGDPYRVLYAFDPVRNAILLIGGNKTGNKRWYDEYVPKADRLYDTHLEELRKEGRI
ncbi:MAG: type II toxin-antitoxin system RelE/ParE family toxin [Pontiellaceae bacterium]|nr:type II toxin-antitoxin system RelE/ParE family toxin [Pontiellaceae bacterium]